MTEPDDMVCCVHHIPGRARFKIEALRRDAVLAETIEVKVTALPGVRAVEINRRAASVIVHYQTGQGEVGAIMDHICIHCPKAALSGRGAVGFPAVPRTGAPRRPISPEFAHAMTTAMSKAVLNTFINRLVAAAI
ncbi:HMA2 domain-containing protein [Paenirhodobacter sp. CAU 1674]|uniref:HMA2 domain-containing protein n=1 Tax=Paenirhodobacter sp. CAU 1674 TaxID=3032596 RepID=UPI0023DA799C|nr:hypothetical protein [Paenirhodobacter sp. CAU 1674]MDF2140884.1 hypothetical protein [Paenirhodobacter sp. CAU 1674]